MARQIGEEHWERAINSLKDDAKDTDNDLTVSVIDIPDDLDEFDSEDIWNQIIEMNEKHGYVDYSELVF